MAFKPIETQYKGFRFRSRLEARWAVFFDELGLSWSYEPEGYQIEHGGEIVFYLPDFEVEGLGVVEVKGPALNKTDRFKIEAFVAEAERDVLLLSDIPPQMEAGLHDVCALIDDEVVWLDVDLQYKYGWVEYERALDAARQARFEHGEKG